MTDNSFLVLITEPIGHGGWYNDNFWKNKCVRVRDTEPGFGKSNAYYLVASPENDKHFSEYVGREFHNGRATGHNYVDCWIEKHRVFVTGMPNKTLVGSLEKFEQ